ncbi:uncharacterized protein LOC111081123 [Drosophila obscura]|uniref:uncharacterized protein LOC111081123 n=1 Tax=Drosophila obscura TaxID=7282 RepID=UPI001BB200E1|nr:uncharacterized protein LOC111081123 [Drosophila obscura]
MYQRKPKKPNWLEILDSSHCLRKYSCKRPRPARSVGCTASNCLQPSLQSTKTNKSAPTKKLKLNMCWQLASDPANLTASMQAAVPVAKARGQEKQNHKPKDSQKPQPEHKLEHKPKERLEHKQKEKLEHKPKEKPKLQDDLGPETEYEQETILQDEHECSEDDKKTKKKGPTRLYSTYRKQSPRRPMDFANIIFLDARTMPWDKPKATSQDGDSCATIKHKHKRVHHSGPKGTGRSNRMYGVPLCGPPSLIMDMVYPPSKQIQLRQEQLYQHSEYEDQYSLMLQSQLQQPEHSHQQQSNDGVPISLQLLAGTEPYTVPSMEQFQRVQKGQRYCGNFYYN